MTRELLAEPAPNWRWRISVADIQGSGAFSAYPGVSRWFAVAQGAGVDLQIHGSPHRQMQGGEALQFDGAAPVHCRLLNGPTRDLNLMLRHAQGSMQVARDGALWSPGSTACGLFAIEGGSCQIDPQESEPPTAIDMPPLSLLWFDASPRGLRFITTHQGATAIGYWLAVTEQTTPC